MTPARVFPASFDRTVVAAIDARLDCVETQHRVRIIHAAESGSRAWGFPSPDSDYDARFVFVRPQADYLSLWPLRDVIETPLDHVLDVNGWDLSMALRLMLKGNAVVLEWLTSPIVYRTDARIAGMLADFAERAASRPAIVHHYFHLGRKQWETLGSGVVPLSLKRILYALRPAVALAWIDQHPDNIVPPMDMGRLLDDTALPSTVRKDVGDLMALKSVTREMGTGHTPASLRQFLDTAFHRDPPPMILPDPAARTAANTMFREIVAMLDIDPALGE